MVDASERKVLADRWLSELSPGATEIGQFEEAVSQRLSVAVVEYKQEILAASESTDAQARKRRLVATIESIENDLAVNLEQTGYLLKLIDKLYADKCDNQHMTLLGERGIRQLLQIKWQSLAGGAI